MTDSAIPEFDITAPTPFTRNGRVSIKASAGTGKTYSLTTTVARLVAEQDLRADQLLLMTFTNEATAELRIETRRRCQEALTALSSGGEVGAWMRHMNEPNLRDHAIRRLDDFLARYDEVTVSTIHGFCQTVLRQAGLDGLAPANFDVVADIDEIVAQTITDLLATKLAENPAFLSGVTTSKKGVRSDVKLSDVASSLDSMRHVVKTLLNNDNDTEVPSGT